MLQFLLCRLDSEALNDIKSLPTSPEYIYIYKYISVEYNSLVKSYRSTRCIVLSHPDQVIDLLAISYLSVY